MPAGSGCRAVAWALAGDNRQTLALLTIAGDWNDLAAKPRGGGAIRLALEEVPGERVPSRLP